MSLVYSYDTFYDIIFAGELDSQCQPQNHGHIYHSGWLKKETCNLPLHLAIFVMYANVPNDLLIVL